MRKKTISIPPYCGNLIMMTYKNEEKFGAKFDIEGIDKFAAFVFVRKKKGVVDYCVAFNVKYKTQSFIIAHEVTHLVNEIYKYHKIYHDVDNDEPQAYLTGWLFKEIEQFLKKK